LHRWIGKERDLFELGYATRFKRGAGLYLGLRPYRRPRIWQARNRQ
jgi:hypothetical protein